MNDKHTCLLAHPCQHNTTFTARNHNKQNTKSFEDRSHGAQVAEGNLGAVDEGGASDELGGGSGREERPPLDLLAVGAEQGRGGRDRRERCSRVFAVLGETELVEEHLLADREGDGLHKRVGEGEVRDSLACKVLGLAAGDGVGAPEQVVAQREAAKRHVELLWSCVCVTVQAHAHGGGWRSGRRAR